MTSDVDWNPSIHDHKVDDIAKFYDDTIENVEYDNFNQYGEYRHRTIAIHDVVNDPTMMDTADYDELVDDFLDTVGKHNCFTISQANVKPDFQLLRPLFGWFPADTIQRTFDVTTQFARGRVSDNLKQHWRSRFPACNVKRRNEPVATDTVFSDTPAVDCGVTAAQLFVGHESLVADVYGLKTDKEFVTAHLGLVLAALLGDIHAEDLRPEGGEKPRRPRRCRTGRSPRRQPASHRASPSSRRRRARAG